MAKTIVGLYDTFAHAQAAVSDLISAGFDRNDISVVANNAHGEFGTTDGTTGGGMNVSEGVGDAVKGAARGGMYGGLTALAASVALLLIPGIGPIAAVGPIAAFFGGAAIGATAGGILGGLTGLGIPKEDAQFYAEGVRRGGTLVTVHADDARASEAMAILNSHNPEDVNTKADYYRSTGFTEHTPVAPVLAPAEIAADRTSYAAYKPTVAATTMNAMDRTVNAGETISVPVIAEELAVGKRAVEGGGARIHTRVIETPVSESVTLHEEHVTVNRTPVDRVVTGTELNNAFTQGTIEVTEYSEVPVVAKEARVVEEVTIGKEATDRVHTVTDTVRRTDVEVEELNTGDTTTMHTTGTTVGSTL